MWYEFSFSFSLYQLSKPQTIEIFIVLVFAFFFLLYFFLSWVQTQIFKERNKFFSSIFLHELFVDYTFTDPFFWCWNFFVFFSLFSNVFYCYFGGWTLFLVWKQFLFQPLWKRPLFLSISSLIPREPFSLPVPHWILCHSHFFFS